MPLYFCMRYIITVGFKAEWRNDARNVHIGFHTKPEGVYLAAAALLGIVTTTTIYLLFKAYIRGNSKSFCSLKQTAVLPRKCELTTVGIVAFSEAGHLGTQYFLRRR